MSSLKAKGCFQIRNDKVTESSYRVNDQTKLVGAVHTIAEKLIKLYMADIAECLLDEKSVKEIMAMPLINDAVSHQIKYFTANINDKLVSRLKDSTFTL